MTQTIAERGTGRQVRSYDIIDYEFRTDESSGMPVFEGIASVVDAPYEVHDAYGTFTETIRSGAFNKTLRDRKADVALFVNHRHTDIPLATRLAAGESGRLDLSVDPNLRVRAVLNPNRPSVVEAVEALRDGNLAQMSIGFTTPRDKRKDRWNDAMTEREITELNLLETSMVWRGANPLTTGSVRSFDEFFESLTDGDLTAEQIVRGYEFFRNLMPADEPVEERSAPQFTVVDDRLLHMWNALRP